MQESNKGARRLRNQVPKISQIYVIKIIYFLTAESKCNKSNKIKLKTSLKLHTQYSKGNIQKEQLNISCGKYLKNIFYENFEKFKLQLNFNTLKKKANEENFEYRLRCVKKNCLYCAVGHGNQYWLPTFSFWIPYAADRASAVRDDRVSCIQPHQIIERGYVLVCSIAITRQPKLDMTTL